MVGIIETEQARGLADVMTLHQQALGLVDDIVVDVTNGGAACCLVHDVAKIAWRIGQF